LELEDGLNPPVTLAKQDIKTRHHISSNRCLGSAVYPGSQFTVVLIMKPTPIKINWPQISSLMESGLF